MKRIESCTKGLVLACSALAFAMAGCSTSTTGETGAIEGQVILPENSDGQLQGQINTIRAVLACTGNDPLTGQPFPTEIFDIDVTNTQNINTPGYKPTLGVFKKEGIPIGANCTVTLVATTTDGLTECGGVGSYTDIPAPPVNGQLSITLNCITAARYGGLRVDGTFNRCMEFQQIIVSPLTANLGPPAGTITTDVWCYDPDGDNGDASVFFIQDDGDGIPPVDPSTWQSCSDVPVMFPGGLPFQYLLPCNHIEPPITFMDTSSGLPNLVTPSASFPLVCNEQSDCLVIVTVSDDTFASGQTDPYGCAGRYPDGRPDYNAFSVIPTECQGDSVCGNNIVEAGEDCDYDGAAAGNTETPPVFITATPVNTWCNAGCDFVEPCTDETTQQPWDCPQGLNPDCETLVCDDSENGPQTCGSTSAPQNGDDCDLTTPGGGANDGICLNGNCTTPPDCVVPGDCGTDTECETFACTAGVCSSTTPFFCNSGAGVCQSTAAGEVCGTGGCTNVSDLTAIGGTFPPDNIDYQTLVNVCSTAEALSPVSCLNYGTTVGTDVCCSGIAGCIITCLENNGISTPCATCYSDTSCTTGCAFPPGNCATDQASQSCQECLWTNGCTQSLSACSGLLQDPPAGCSLPNTCP